MSIKPYHIIPPAITSGSVYLFTTDSGIDYEVRFARKRDNLLHATIAFGVLNEEFEGEEYVVTNRGEVYRVMATVVDIVKEYMHQHPNVKTFEFTGEPTPTETEKNARKRLNLYNRYLKNIFDSSWKFKGDGNHMLVYRNDV